MFEFNTASVEIGVFCNDGVIPKFFKIVSCAGVGQEDMNPYIAIIKHNPLRVVVGAIAVEGLYASVFLQAVAQMVGYGTYLGG